MAANGGLRSHGMALMLDNYPANGGDSTDLGWIVAGDWWDAESAMSGFWLDFYGYRCAVCGGWFKFCDVDIDHRRPLWSLDDDERTDMRWWGPGNLQTLCRPCHKAKTRGEAADRAALKRISDAASVGQHPLFGATG